MKNEDEDFVDFDDVCQIMLGLQSQYDSRYLTRDVPGWPNLVEGLRFKGDAQNYHTHKIHKDDVEEFVRRHKEYLKDRTIPKTIEDCGMISCNECVYKETTIHGYGIHIDDVPFPLYTPNRCTIFRPSIIDVSKKILDLLEENNFSGWRSIDAINTVRSLIGKME